MQYNKRIIISKKLINQIKKILKFFKIYLIYNNKK